MSLSRVPVESGAAFSRGVLVGRVQARRSYDEASKSYGDQEIDKASGLPKWNVEGYDLGAMAAPPVETKSGFVFREPAEVRVCVLSAEEPVIPANEVNGFSGVAQFVGLTEMPYLSDRDCKPGKARCGCKIKMSYQASGVVPFRG